MRLISSELGLTTAETFYLSAVTEQPSTPVAPKVSPRVQRVDKDKLEQLYISDAIIFNSINKLVQVIMSAGFKLIGDKKSVEFFNEFLSNIGAKGGEYEWQSLLDTIFRHLFVYGNAWIELIYNKRGTHIVDLDFIDPKRMDFVRNSMGQIIVDKFNNPAGYTLKLPPNIVAENKFKPPEGALMPPNSIFIPPERVAHFTLYTIGDGFDGIGLIEPIYKTALRKANMEEALANSWWLTGFPLKKGKVGDINHEPTEEQMRKMAETIKNLDYKSSIVVPYYADVEILEAKRPEKLKEQLSYFIDEEIAGLGVPKAYATGSGEATNRSTLNSQEYLMKIALKDVTTKVCKTIEQKIFRTVAEQNKLETYPLMKWGEIAIEELDSKASRLAKYVKYGIVKPDKNIETLIRKEENLPLPEEKV